MMLKHDLGNRPGELYSLQYVITSLRVVFNETEFDISYPSRFTENFTRYRYLAQIMNKSRYFGSFNLLCRKVHFFGYSITQNRHPPLVTSSVRVSRFHH